jgi:hypothetical protein
MVRRGLFGVHGGAPSQITMPLRPPRAIRRSCSPPVGNGAPEQNAEIYAEPEADSDGSCDCHCLPPVAGPAIGGSPHDRADIPPDVRIESEHLDTI